MTKIPEDPNEWGHWIAAPMRNVGTITQFHKVVNRAQQIIDKLSKERDAVQAAYDDACDEIIASHEGE